MFCSFYICTVLFTTPKKYISTFHQILREHQRIFRYHVPNTTNVLGLYAELFTLLTCLQIISRLEYFSQVSFIGITYELFSTSTNIKYAVLFTENKIVLQEIFSAGPFTCDQHFLGDLKSTALDPFICEPLLEK